MKSIYIILLFMIITSCTVKKTYSEAYYHELNSDGLHKLQIIHEGDTVRFHILVKTKVKI